MGRWCSNGKESEKHDCHQLSPSVRKGAVRHSCLKPAKNTAQRSMRGLQPGGQDGWYCKCQECVGRYDSTKSDFSTWMNHGRSSQVDAPVISSSDEEGATLDLIFNWLWGNSGGSGGAESLPSASACNKAEFKPPHFSHNLSQTTTSVQKSLDIEESKYHSGRHCWLTLNQSSTQYDCSEAYSRIERRIILRWQVGAVNEPHKLR